MDDSYECETDNESAEFVSERLPNSNNVIRGQKDAYAVGKKIAPGKYGAVYEVLRRRDGKMFAAKLEVCDVAVLNALNMDYVVLRAAQKAKLLGHFCALVDRGMIQDHFKFLVMNRLGENLYKLRLQFQQERFSAPTALRIALEMLNALEQLHSMGYIHRDVKPSNFAISDEKGMTERVILLDFGLCRHFQTSAGGIKPPREHTQFRGSARYASLAAHRAQEQSPKDDLESWLYVVAEFMAGDLPWSHLQASERDSVKKAKENARTPNGMANLFKYCPKMEFKRILTYLDGLQYDSMPDYKYLHNLIILAMRNNDIRSDEPYDWEQQDEGEETGGTGGGTSMMNGGTSTTTDQQQQKRQLIRSMDDQQQKKGLVVIREVPIRMEQNHQSMNNNNHFRQNHFAK